MNIDDKLKRMPRTVRVGIVPGGLSEFINIQDAVDYCDNETGEWTIELYTGAYNEGDITPGGGASITLRGMGADRVRIAPTAAPAAAVIVSAFNLHLENLIVASFDATRPALRVTGGVCSGKHTLFVGVGAGDAIQQVGGNIELDDCQTPIGDVDLSTGDCTFEAHDSHFHGPIDTAAEARAHTLLLVQCDLHNQGISSLATGATTLDARGCSNMGLVQNNGTSDWVIRDSDVGAANQQDAGGSITLYGGDLGSIAGHVGPVVWWKDSTLIRVPEGGDLQQAVTALPAAGGWIRVGGDTFALPAQVTRAIDNVKIIGSGLATRFTLDGVTPVISAGVQDGWILADFDVDAGLVDIAAATNSTLHNITINGLHATIINPDVGQTNFPGQPVIRTEEIRPLDPAATEIIKDFSRKEYQLYNPTFATPRFIMELLNRQARTLELPLNGGWTDGSTVGSAVIEALRMILNTTAAANSDGLAYCVAAFLNDGGVAYDRVDWDNMYIWAFDVERHTGNHADLRGRVQLKEVNTEGILADLGIGIEIQNYAIHGESYHAARATVDLGVTMTATHTYRIMIVLIPGVSVDFYVNGIYRGRITTQVPDDLSDATCYFVASMDNAAQAVDCNLVVSPMLLWNHL